MNNTVHVNTEVINRRPRPFITNGEKVKRLRKLAGGASQEHFARLAGISRRYWIQIETGEKIPSGIVRDKIAAALNADPSEITSSDDEDEESADLAMTRDLLAAIDQLVARRVAAIAKGGS